VNSVARTCCSTCSARILESHRQVAFSAVLTKDHGELAEESALGAGGDCSASGTRDVGEKCRVLGNSGPRIPQECRTGLRRCRQQEVSPNPISQTRCNLEGDRQFKPLAAGFRCIQSARVRPAYPSRPRSACSGRPSLASGKNGWRFQIPRPGKVLVGRKIPVDLPGKMDGFETAKEKSVLQALVCVQDRARFAGSGMLSTIA